MTTRSSEIYAALGLQIASQGFENDYGIRRELEFENSNGSVEAFFDAPGSMGLFVPFGSDEKLRFTADLQSRYITLSKIPRNGRVTAQLRLEDSSLSEVFFIFVDTFLKEFEEEPENAVSLLSNQLKQWRSLFTPNSVSTMSEVQQLGLICELQVLEQLLETDGESAFYRWTGPDASKHDFQLEDRDIECKATSIQKGLQISINGLHQLHPEPNRKMILAVRKYEKTPNGDISLSELVNRLANRIEIPTDEFLKTLQKIGYSLIEKTANNETRYSNIGSFVFEVDDRFPRLNTDGFPERIVRVNYEVDLHPAGEIPGYRSEGSLS
ncbi:PD-(D/E)XK motif protein [Corynebacterium lubricantis]|uniref:PD-(D/E)XK motif protein n=1 Tax=Corynebacterium lubricantis TaxID=541095 RepID=UPI00036A860F|nr:PD-(D/E)XK motif protein [Corynebacterium lubricantis]